MDFVLLLDKLVWHHPGFTQFTMTWHEAATLCSVTCRASSREQRWPINLLRGYRCAMSAPLASLSMSNMFLDGFSGKSSWLSGPKLCMRDPTMVSRVLSWNRSVVALSLGNIAIASMNVEMTLTFIVNSVSPDNWKLSTSTPALATKPSKRLRSVEFILLANACVDS